MRVLRFTMDVPITKLNNLRTSIRSNFFVHLVYRTKFYFDLGVGQISWFTGKLPEVMAVVYLFDRSGIYLSTSNLIIISCITFIIITSFGLIMKYSGLWDTECYVNTWRNPVSTEILQAARLINERYSNDKGKEINNKELKN